MKFAAILVFSIIREIYCLLDLHSRIAFKIKQVVFWKTNVMVLFSLYFLRIEDQLIELIDNEWLFGCHRKMYFPCTHITIERKFHSIPFVVTFSFYHM